MNRRIMKKRHKKQILQEICKICDSPFPWAVIHTGKNVNIFTVKDLSIIRKEPRLDLLERGEVILGGCFIPEYDVNFTATEICGMSRKDYERAFGRKIKMWRD